jgi:GAF domain-containing protein
VTDEKSNFNYFINQIMRISKSATNRNDKLIKICKLLYDNIEYYDWVGIYFASSQGNELTLGPYIGEDTEHKIIPFGQGICGQAAQTKETFLVQDVSKETNYLSCSPNVKSEIVVPIMKQDTIMGELDIDSHQINPFTEDDKLFLESVCNIISQFM